MSPPPEIMFPDCLEKLDYFESIVPFLWKCLKYAAPQEVLPLSFTSLAFQCWRFCLQLVWAEKPVLEGGLPGTCLCLAAQLLSSGMRRNNSQHCTVMFRCFCSLCSLPWVLSLPSGSVCRSLETCPNDSGSQGASLEPQDQGCFSLDVPQSWSTFIAGLSRLYDSLLLMYPSCPRHSRGSVIHIWVTRT